MPYDATEHRDSRGRFASPHGDAVKEAVRVDYEGDGLFLREIEEKHHIAANTIDQWARRGGWKRRQPHTSIDPEDLVRRMIGLLSGQIADLEAVVKNGRDEVAMLAKLVTTLDKVLLLKGKTAAEKPKSSKRLDELRAKIAERISELNRN